MARALGFRQIRSLSFSSQRSRTITPEYNQIISTSRWVKKVELYTSMLTCISQDGNDLIILETEDSTIQPALLALLVLRSEQQMPLRAYCEERFRITVSLGPGSALGEKGKRRGQIGKISASEVSRARFFFFSPTPIFSPFPHNVDPGPRQDYSQTEKTMNTRNISGMLLCCEKKPNQARENSTASKNVN